MALQSGILAIGAWLVIRQEATGGIIIAASILSSRALAPIELAISSWKSFVGARQSWKRLSDLLDHFPDRSIAFELPAPSALLSVENQRRASRQTEICGPRRLLSNPRGEAPSG